MNFRLPNADAIMSNLNKTPDDMDGETEIPCDVEDVKKEHNCPICSHNSDEASVIQKMNEIERDLTGRVSCEEIYNIQHQLYEHQIRQPLLRQKIDCPEITLDHIRNHYQHHKLNLRQIISNEILLVNTMQVHFRKSQIATKCLKDGRKTLNMKGVDQWIS